MFREVHVSIQSHTPLPKLPFMLSVIAAMASCMVRTSPSEDFTNGFFVACFRKATVELSSTELNSNKAHKMKQRTRSNNTEDDNSRAIDEAGMATSGTKRKRKKKAGKEKGSMKNYKHF